jgi:hypothetical protein
MSVAGGQPGGRTGEMSKVGPACLAKPQHPTGHSAGLRRSGPDACLLGGRRHDRGYDSSSIMSSESPSARIRADNPTLS